jgi:CheY-like chemotaxis protein
MARAKHLWLSPSQRRPARPRLAASDEMARSILVADDNPLVRKMLCQMFEREEDYDLCAEAADGEEAIALAIRHRPDLIILDMSMPVMNGLVAARELKRLMPNIPIILFTLFAEQIDVSHVGVDRIVSKSDPSSLMSHVRSLAPV